MKVTLHRRHENPLSTVGEMNVDGIPTNICTLEDAFHKIKIHGSTRIPAGVYKLKLRDAGGVHEKYSDRFGAMHKGMIWLQDVPGFEWIYVHCGNEVGETDGCILVGTYANRPKDETKDAWTIGGSEKAYRLIYPPIAAAIAHGVDVSLEVLDVPNSQSLVA